MNYRCTKSKPGKDIPRQQHGNQQIDEADAVRVQYDLVVRCFVLAHRLLLNVSDNSVEQ